MDVGLLDDIENRRGLVAGDRECFYQMLAAVGRGADPNLSDGADDKYRDVVPLFNEPDDAQGRLYELEGTARRAMRIAVVDEDVRERLGFDHYYEVDVFPDDAQGNPVVFCMRELPARMPQGPEIEERVRAAGFFMKVWRYRRFRPSDTAEQGEGGEPVLQLAPLLIGREPVWIPAPGLARNNYAAAVLGAMFLVVLGGIWLVVWRSSRTERRRAHMGADAAHLPVDGAPLGTSSREPDGNAGVDPAR